MPPAEVVGSLDAPGPAPRAASRPSPSPALVISAVAIACAALLPAAYLVVRAWEGGVSAFFDVVTEGRTIGLLVRTIMLACAVTASAIAIAVPLAWLTTRTDLPGRRTWVLVTTLPLVIPTYVGAYAVIAALGPRGILQGWLEPLGIQRLPELYGFAGAWLVLTLFTYPYILLIVRAAIRRLDPALEEASISLGQSRKTTFRRVVLPQLRPSIVAGGLLVALYTAHDFGAVSLMRFDTFTQGIYTSYKGSFDRSRAASLALVLVALTLVVLALESRTRGRGVPYRVSPGSSRMPHIARLGRRKWLAFAACCVLATLALFLPIGVLVYGMARSARAAEPLSSVFAASGHSIQVAAVAAFVALASGWPLAVLSARHPGRLERLTERSSFVGYALPGLVVALALVFFGARYVPALYQTLPMLVFAYVVLFLPQASGALRASLLQVPPHLEEVARSLGSTRGQTLRRVVLPLVRPGLVAGGTLVFLTVMKELPATLLLAPTGFQTLASEVWSATSASHFDSAAVPALALVALSSVPTAILLSRDGQQR